MVCTAGTSGETLREECSLSASCFSGPIKSVCVQSYSNAAAEGIEMNWIAMESFGSIQDFFADYRWHTRR